MRSWLILVIFQKCLVFPQAPNSSESPGTSRTEHSDLLEEEEDERSDIKVKQKILIWRNTLKIARMHYFHPILNYVKFIICFSLFFL